MGSTRIDIESIGYGTQVYIRYTEALCMIKVLEPLEYRRTTRTYTESLGNGTQVYIGYTGIGAT